MITPPIELTAAVMDAVRAVHYRAFKRPAKPAELKTYTTLIGVAIAQFEQTYASIPFFRDGPVHSFEGFSIAAAGDRYPSFTLPLVFIRRSNNYLVGTPEEIKLDESYAVHRLMEEAKHIASLPES